MKRLKLAVLLSPLFFTGCVSATFAATNAPPRPISARPVSEVFVYEASVPDRPYVEVGVIAARTDASGPAEKNRLVRLAREQAAERGCDALILKRGSEVVAEGSCVVFQ